MGGPHLVKRTLLSALIGALVAVVIAFASAVWSPITSFVELPGASWPGSTPDNWPHSPSGVWCQSGFGIRLTQAYGGGLLTTPSDAGGQPILTECTQCTIEAGWPFSAFRSAQSLATPMSVGTAPILFYFPRLGMGIPDSLRPNPHGLGAIPTEPTWPGALANTGAFGAVAFFVWCSFLAAHRWWLRSHGRCVRCGYSLAASSSHCPECGPPSNDRSSCQRPTIGGESATVPEPHVGALNGASPVDWRRKARPAIWGSRSGPLQLSLPLAGTASTFGCPNLTLASAITERRSRTSCSV